MPFAGLGNFGAGDIVAYLGVGNTTQFESQLRKAQMQTEAAAKKMQMALNFVAAAGAAVFVGAIKAASDFESSFAGVIKTVDGLDDGFGNLNDSGKALALQFRNLALEIPISVNELNKIGELGGQLGIAKEDLISFTDTIARLGVSTNLTIEAAATEIARFVNITKQVAPEGMNASQQIERIGATMVALGNNFATTEAEISGFAQRLAGTGSTIGLSQSDILAFSAALSSVGLNAEAGGTAFSRLFTNLSKAVGEGGKILTKFAQVSNMSAADFSRAFKEDAAGAISAFITGLGNITRSGGSTFEVLEELDMSEIRLRDSLLRASNASELVTKALDLSSTAYKENNALVTESNKRFETFESQLKLLKNAIYEGFIILGNQYLPKLKELVKVLTENPEKVAEFVENIGKFVIVLGGLAIITKTVILITNLQKAFVALRLSLVALSGPVGPIVLLTAAFVGLYTAISNFEKKNIENITKGLSLEELKTNLEKYNQEYEKFVELQKTAAPAAINIIAGKIQEYKLKIEETKKRIEEIGQATTEFSDDTNALTGDIGELNDKVTIAGDSVKRLSSFLAADVQQTFGSGPIKTFEELQKRIEENVLWSGYLDEHIKEIRGTFKYTEPEIKLAERSLELLHAEVKDGDERWEEYKEILEKNAEEIIDVIDGVGGLLSVLTGSESLNSAVSFATNMLSGLASGGLSPVTAGLGFLTFAIAEATKTTKLAHIPFDELTSSLGGLYEATLKARQAWYGTPTDEEMRKKEIEDLLKLQEATASAIQQMEAAGAPREMLEHLYGVLDDVNGRIEILVKSYNEDFNTALDEADKNIETHIATIVRWSDAYSSAFSMFSQNIGDAFGDYYAYVQQGRDAISAINQAVFFGISQEDTLLDEIIGRLMNSWLAYLATLDPSSEAFRQGLAALQELRSAYNDWLYPAIDDVAAANDVLNESLEQTPGAIDDVRNAAESAGRNFEKYAGQSESAASAQDGFADAAGDVNEVLEDQVYLVNKLSLAYENWLGFTLDQFDEYLNQLGRFDKEGVFDPSGPLFDALQRLLDFGISFEDTNIDEQIAAWILQVEAFLATLDPDSVAYRQLSDALDALKEKFEAMGGQIEDSAAKAEDLIGSLKRMQDFPVIAGQGGENYTGYHSGGIVTAHNGLYTGEEILAKLQRGEAVINRQVVNMYGADAFQDLNRSGSLRKFAKGEQPQQTTVNIEIREPGPYTYATLTDEVYPRIKNRQRNYEPRGNPYS